MRNHGMDPAIDTANTAPAGRSAGISVTGRDVRVCAILIGFFFVFNILQMWNHWSVDFSAYYLAGYFYGTGQLDLIYAGPDQIIGPQVSEGWRTTLAAMGYGGHQTYPYIYLPWVAAIMAPVALYVDAVFAMNAMLLVNCALIVWSVHLAWKIMAPKETPLWLWYGISMAILATSTTSQLALFLGQIQILVIALCLFAFERYKARAFWVAGAALALAACLKITPAAFAIIFLWDRNWRALAGFFVVGAVVSVLSLAFIGWPLHAQYFGVLRELSENVFLALVAFSLESLAYQLSSLVNGTAPILNDIEYSFPKPGWIDPLTKATLLVGLVAIWGVTCRLHDESRLGRQLLALSILVPLTAPLGWSHYFLMTTLLLPGLLELMNRKLAICLILAYGTVLSMFALLSVTFEGLRFMPQTFWSVPVLMSLLLAIILFGHRQNAVANSAELEILPAE